MGVNKIPGYQVLIGGVYDSGFKQVPLVDKKVFTQRECSKDTSWAGVYSGNVRAIPYLPYYGPKLATNAALAYANNVGVTGRSTAMILYDKGVCKNIALSRFVQEMMSDLSQSSLGVSVIEGRESLNMIKTRIGNLAKTMWYLRRGDLAKAKRAFSDSLQVGRYDTAAIMKMRRKKSKYFNDLKNRIPNEKHSYSVEKVALDKVSSLWLEYWLGWAPMVADVNKLMDVLATSAAKLPTEGIIIKASALQKHEWDYDMSGGYTRGAPRVYVQHRHTITGQVAVNDPEKFLNRRAGLTNLPAVIYAGVTLSFILEWFIGFGKVLELTDSFTGVLWKKGSYSDTYTATCNEKIEHRETAYDKFTATTYSASQCSVSRRYVLTSAPVGSYIPRFKDLRTIFEGKEHRAWTSVSLLTQFLISHRNKTR
jgi:hypothetical protein